jgi:hypothetical protein
MMVEGFSTSTKPTSVCWPTLALIGRLPAISLASHHVPKVMTEECHMVSEPKVDRYVALGTLEEASNRNASRVGVFLSHFCFVFVFPLCCKYTNSLMINRISLLFKLVGGRWPHHA